MLPEFDIVVAVDNRMGIARAGQIPWHLAGDLKQFKKLTTSTSSPDKKNLVIMGRKTWDTLPEAYKPLPDRINCVLTRNTDFLLPENTFKVRSFKQALLASQKFKDPDIERIFVMGGGAVYQEAVSYVECRKIYMTQIMQDFHCDVFFPSISSDFKKIHQSPCCREAGLEYSFSEYVRLHKAL